MNICIFEPYILEHEYGNQKYLSGLVKYLETNTLNIYIFVQKSNAFIEKLRKFGAKIVVIDPPEKMKIFGKDLLRENLFRKILTVRDLISYSRKIGYFLKKYDIDIIQSNNLRSVISIGFSALVCRIPIIWYIKGHLENRLLDNLSFLMVSKVVFQSRSNKERAYPLARKIFENKMIIIENGIDLEEISNSICLERIETVKKDIFFSDNKRFNILYSGAITSNKGIYDLLVAINYLKKRHIKVNLFILGAPSTPSDVDYMKKLEKYISINSLTNISFLGYRNDAVSIASLMDLYILPSYAEGVPRSILEAFAVGLPVIATDVGGIKEIIEKSNAGIVVNPGDWESLAKRIEYLKENKEIRKSMGTNGKKYVWKNHSLDEKVKQLHDLYIEVYNNK